MAAHCRQTLVAPAVVVISGPPGCGKTTMAKALARQLPAVHLDKDAVDEPFSPNYRGRHYTEAIEPRVLEALLRLARLNLEAGHDVILDAPWTHIQLNSPRWTATLRDLGHPLRVLECVLEPSELRRRIERRSLDRDREKLSDEGWPAFLERDRVGAVNPLPHQVIDMHQPVDACVAQALRHIRADTFTQTACTSDCAR